MYNEEVIWINQSLYSYKDNAYHSDGYLDISIVVTTTDYINFSKPRFSISIDNNRKRRVCSICRSNVSDLVRTFNTVAPNLKEIYDNPESGDITKRYNKKRDLIFEFRKDPNTGDRLVVIRIVFGPSDEGKVIIPLSECQEIIELARMFKDKYVDLMLGMKNGYLLSMLVQEQKAINASLKILPSQLVGQVSPQEVAHDDEPIDVDTSNIDDFEKFVTENEDNVKIPELDSDVVAPQEPVTQEFQSNFLDNILKGDCQVFDQMMTAVMTDSNPLDSIIKHLKVGEGVELFPGMSIDDYKSICYMSNILFRVPFQKYMLNNVALPATSNILKYSPSETSQYNTDLAHDILLMNSYLRIYRSKIESVNSDAYSNGAMVFMATRCFMDVLCFSFLDHQNPEAIKNYVVSKYKDYLEKGFFRHYQEMLTMNNCKDISPVEVGAIVEKALEAGVKTSSIDLVHNAAYDDHSVILPYKNTFELEQITNEIVPLEVKVRLGADPSKETDNEDYLGLFGNSQIKKRKPKRTQHKTEPTKKETNIVRYIRFVKDSIQDKYVDKLLRAVDGLEESNYDFSNPEIPSQELDESVLQGLYVWNESEKNEGYKSFFMKIEECISKDLILAKIQGTENLEDNTGSEGDWLGGANLDL